MISADQLVLHGIGDYLLQSDWMANNKTKRHIPAMAHAVVYSLPFLLLRPSLAAFAVILGTHFLIDRYRLARFVCWAKNWIAPFVVLTAGPNPTFNVEYNTPPVNLPWRECSTTGYPPDRPAWLAVWLLIIADNLLHVIINGAALRFL